MNANVPLDVGPRGGRWPSRHAAYDRLKDAILKGEIPPGSLLVEARVAEWCGVSRTPIREALTRLEQDGLVERTGRGLAVKQRSPDEILDIYEVRIGMESLTARSAAERRTAHDLRRLENIAANAPNVRRADIVDYNHEFHRAVWTASHNDTLVGLMERLSWHLTRYPETTLFHPGRWESAVEEHQQLVDAIRDGDPDVAAKVATLHFTAARDIRLKLYEMEAF